MSGAQPVDVLAVLQADIDSLEQRVLAGEFQLSSGYDKVNGLRAVRAAVAQLIEAAKVAETLTRGGVNDSAILRLALARVGGAA